jgi:hypothetical protein
LLHIAVVATRSITTFITATLATTTMPSLQQHSHPLYDKQWRRLLDPKLCCMDG